VVSGRRGPHAGVDAAEHDAQTRHQDVGQQGATRRLQVVGSRPRGHVRQAIGAARVTASFLKELLRRAALLAAQRTASGPLSVSADDLSGALDELLDTRNAMTRILLGGGTPPSR